MRGSTASLGYCSPKLRSTTNLQDYNNKLAQLRAGKSSKSKLLLAKFKSVDSLNGWEIRQGTYFQDVIAAKYDGGMDAKFEFMETGDAVFSGKTTGNQLNYSTCTFCGIYVIAISLLPSNSSEMYAFMHKIWLYLWGMKEGKRLKKILIICSSYATVTRESSKSLSSVFCCIIQGMFSPEEGTWSCQKSFHFLLGALLTGI